jgi:hypothetical protein
VNQQLQIKSDKTIKKIALENTQNEKILVVNKVKNTVLDKKASTSFRNRLFGKRDSENLSLGQIGGLTTKIPSIPLNFDASDLKQAKTFEKANIMAKRERFGLGPPVKQT